MSKTPDSDPNSANNLNHTNDDVNERIRQLGRRRVLEREHVIR